MRAPATLSPAPKAGALSPPSGFPAGGFGDTASPPRVSLPSFAAPIRASSPPHEAAKSPAAAHPGGRGANLSGPAPDLAALVAITLFVAAVVAVLAGLTGPGGA